MAIGTFIASAPQPVAAIPAKQVFQLTDLLPEDLSQVFVVGSILWSYSPLWLVSGVMADPGGIFECCQILSRQVRGLRRSSS